MALPTLSDEQLDRYARHIVLRDIGGAGQRALLSANVLVIGAGGIGCPAVQYLAAAGVGRMTIMDDDVIGRSNLQRQVLYRTDDIGRGKAEIAASVASALNPDCVVSVVAERFTAQHCDTVSAFDVVLDGTDSYAARLSISDACTAAHVPLVSAAIGMFQGQVATFRGWLPDQPCYRCFVGDAHDADDCDSCADLGVLGAMCGMVGSFAAIEAIRAITGFGDDPAGKLHILDGLKPAMRTVRVAKDPACRTCGDPAKLASAHPA